MGIHHIYNRFDKTSRFGEYTIDVRFDSHNGQMVIWGDIVFNPSTCTIDINKHNTIFQSMDKNILLNPRVNQLYEYYKIFPSTNIRFEDRDGGSIVYYHRGFMVRDKDKRDHWFELPLTTNITNYVKNFDNKIDGILMYLL